ncbi:hypothetical protein BE18_20045 [Sorangium cellulosum]|uniref:Uncharacterized protein n=1 Tax=Sorangium cellulosum TaxID=56 RepID=A0A150RMZ5_SORCE|nr:hypothetical protein BE18_20045 [Sorangium cellulosum]
MSTSTTRYSWLSGSYGWSTSENLRPGRSRRVFVVPVASSRRARSDSRSTLARRSPTAGSVNRPGCAYTSSALSGASPPSAVASSFTRGRSKS